MEEYILPIKTQIVRDALTTAVQEIITEICAKENARNVYSKNKQLGLIVELLS